MASISEHQVIKAYLEEKLGEKYRNKPNHFDKYHHSCLDVFGFYDFKVDLSTEENGNKFKAYVLHYKCIVSKILRAKKDSRKSVYDKFPDSEKSFYSPSNDNTFINQQVAR